MPFTRPDFRERPLELRFENNEVCIYGTKAGLTKLSDLITSLVNKPKSAHIHLEDYELLTRQSLNGAIAIFDE